MPQFPPMRCRPNGGWRATSRLLVAWGVLCGLLSGNCPADTKRKINDPSKIEAMIQGLRSPSFRARVQAETDCRETGHEMLPALNAALKSSDPELRRRAQLLIERIEDDELTESLDAFLRQEPTASLPGWPIVDDLVADTPEVRVAFATILRGSSELSRALSHPEHIAEEIQRQLQNRSLLGTVPRTISPADTSALLLLLVHPQANYTADAGELASRLVWAGVSHAEFDINTLRDPSHAATNAKHGAMLEILRALVTRWVTISRAGTPQNRLLTASRLGLAEAVVPALEIIQQKNNSHLIGNAFVAIANHGGADEMAIIETMLNDDFVLSSSQKGDNEITVSTQLRDVALAALIEMTHQKPEDYDMRIFPRDTAKRVSAFPVGFDSQERREKAFEKWRIWSTAHLKKYRPMAAQAEEGTSL